MAKKKKDEVVATIGLDGKIVKNTDKQNKNVVAEVDYEGNIRPYAPAPSVNNNRNNSSVSSSMNAQNDAFSKGTAFQNQQPSILEEDNSLDTSMTVKKNIENQISKNIVQGTFQRDIQDKTTNIEKNKSIIAPKPANSTKFDTSDIKYQDTGKTYGDYYYNDYAKLKDVPIYKDSKGKYYTFYNNKYEPLGTGITGSVMTSKEEEKKQLEEAKKNGYKEQKRTKTKEYKKAEKSFTKLKKEYNLTDEELNDFINNGNLSYKGLKFNIVTNSMMNAVHDADDYRKRIKEGKIKKYDDNAILSVEQLLDLETNDLTKKQRKEYTEDLIRQNKKNNSDKSNRINYGYDGTLSGTIKALGSTTNKVKDSLNTNIVEPANNIKDLYEYGKKQNDLSLEYYKKMEGENNNVKSKQREMDLYEKFNQDLITDKSWGAEAIRNANTQVESIKNQGISATAFGTVGSAIGTIINPGAGTIAGAKIGGSIGYTLGSIPYTYKLEAGNQYKTLVEMGVPENIAKKHSKRVGAINAAIESGENVVDLFTFNSGSGTKAITKQTVSDLVDEYGEKQVNSWLSKKIGDKAANMMVTSAKSYAQNIASESVEEMTQETTSIASERLASKESNINRNSSLKKDIARVLEAGSSAAISTAFTAPISSVSGSIASNTMNNIQSKIENKVVKSNVINNEIMKEINKSNSNISNEDALNIQRQVYQELDNNGIEIVNAQQNNKNEKYSNVNPPMAIKYQETDNQKINTFRQSVVREEMLNSKKTTDTMNVVEKIIKDKDYSVIFDRTITNLDGKSVDGKININKNGEVEIALNPNSDRAVEFLLAHEVTHAIETEELRGIILDYAKKNPEFKSALKDLQKTYGTTNVNDEVVADISAQILGNQEFINSLSSQSTPQSRNIIKNIYESIKRVLNNFTSKGRYRNFVQDLETKWRDAYRVATNETTKNNLQKIEKYSKVYNNDGTVNRIRINDNVFEGSKDKSISKTIKDYLTKHIGEVYTIIESGQKVYLGKDLPNEYAHSEYTKKLPLNKKLAKGRAVTNLNEIIESATNRTWESNKKEKHKIDAKYGFYKYNTTFSFDYNGSEKIYDGTILIRNDANGKKYLYDILDVKPKKKLVSLPLVASNSNKSSAINSGSSNQSANNIPQSNNNVKSDISTKYSMQSKENNTQELDNSSFSLKEKQLEIIKKENPMLDDYHTGIRTIDDIKTPEEAFKTKIDEDEDYSYPDFTQEDGEKALESGKITVYSSQEIKQGTFVSPSKSMAQDYAGDGKIFEQTISINDVAWINSDEGQYAKVDNSKYSQKAPTWQEHLEENYKATGTRTYFDEMTNSQKKQIAPVSQYNMQQNEKNIPIAKEYQKNTIDEKKSNKDEYIRIANTINETIKGNTIVGSEVKERSWIETPLESEVVKDKVLIEDLDPDKINYTVKSNKKTLKKANKKIDLMGYEESVKYIKSKLNDDNISLTDIVMGERIIQEAIKKGDKQLASDLITDIAILGTELGQKVQALSIIQRLTPEGQLKMFQKIVKRAKIRGEKSFQDVEITPEMVELILNAYDKNGNFNQDDLNNRVEQFKQEIADQLKTSTEEKIDAWRYLSMLGNPKTHIRNIVSNVAMKGTVAYKNALARTLETVLPIKNRTKTWKKTSEEVKQYAKQTAIEMKDTITGNNKFSEKGSIESKKRIFKNKFLESLSNFNSDMLELEDWFFSKSAFINSFQEYLTANGIMTKEDINNNSEIIEKGKNYAVEQAEIATFRQYSKLASEINRIERNNKVAKYPIKAMVPFKKTPINVAKTGVKYSPLGLIKNISYDVVQLKKGNIEASQFIDNLSQGVAGTSLMLLGYGLSKAGILLGSGDDDKEGKYDSLLGKTGYSIKIGNKYYSLSWLSPVAMPLFVGSNFYEQLEEKKGWDMNVVSDTLAKTLDPLSEMSFVSSLNDALSSYGSGTDKIFSMGESVAQSYIGQFFPTLFSQFSNTFDDTKRSTKASSNSSYKFGEQTLRSIMYKIPGLHNKLEPSVDVWGNELKQSNNVLTRAFESFIAPYSARKDITSKLDKEIKRVYKEVGNDDVIPGVPRTDITYKKEKYRMSASEYTNYRKEYGESANTMLKMLINSDNYKDSSDTRKTRMIKKIYDYSKEIAKAEFLEKRKIKFDDDDFKTSTMDYEDIVDYILRNTRYMDGE